jgi:thiamine biosynthesis protein ThiS
VAVAVGFDVVERDRWSTTPLKENDKVTIIGAVCGG